MVGAIFNGKLYFSGSDGSGGYELWVTDGTAAGTTLVKDISPSGDGFPRRFMEYNGKLYFAATTPTEGEELWVTDGTASGTMMLKDINGNSGTYPESAPVLIKVFNNKLYFTAQTNAEGRELWTTDGTANGTVLFKAFQPGVAGGDMLNFTEFNGSLYFTIFDFNFEREMWKSDGTTAGTTLFLDSTLSLNSVSGSLYMSRRINNIFNLFKTDGNTANMIQVEPSTITHDYYSDYFIPVGGVIYYGSDSISEGANYNNLNLWATDGTPANTHRVTLPDATKFIGHNKENIVNIGNSIYVMKSFDLDTNPIYTAGIYRITNTSNPASISEVEPNHSLLKLYPNPTNAVLNLEISNSAVAEFADITIFNLQGAVVYQTKSNIHPGINHQTISLAGLSSGIYFLQLKGNTFNVVKRFEVN